VSPAPSGGRPAAGTQPAVLPVLQAIVGARTGRLSPRPNTRIEINPAVPNNGDTRSWADVSAMTCPADPVKLLRQLLHGERASATPIPVRRSAVCSSNHAALKSAGRMVAGGLDPGQRADDGS
jgi:hypothetical protein